MNFSKLIFTFLFVNVLSLDVSAQENQATTGLHPKAATFALEVYQDVTEYQTSTYLLEYSERIQRVSVVNVGSEASNYPSLETVGLRDKYNPNLKIDKEGFDPLYFNPIKYHFEFNNTEVQKFRIGNSGYIVVIDSFHN